MTDDQAIGFAVVGPILLLALAVWVRAWIKSIDRKTPKWDWTAHQKRQITHRGFKSRMGAREFR